MVLKFLLFADCDLGELASSPIIGMVEQAGEPWELVFFVAWLLRMLILANGFELRQILGFPTQGTSSRFEKVSRCSG
jgi:hypothetical protein